MLTEKEQEKLNDFFRDGAEGIEAEPEYWVNGGEGLSFCYDCCGKEVSLLKKDDPENNEYCCVDGGWIIDGDSIPYCETCDKLLKNTLTYDGCEDEVNHFLEHGFDPCSASDCYSMERVIAGRGWEIGEERIYRNEYDKEGDIKYYKNLEILCKRILKEVKNVEKI